MTHVINGERVIWHNSPNSPGQEVIVTKPNGILSDELSKNLSSLQKKYSEYVRKALALPIA